MNDADDIRMRRLDPRCIRSPTRWATRSRLRARGATPCSRRTSTGTARREFDVYARNTNDARALTREEMERDFDPGLTIVHVEERFGLFM